MIEFVNVMLSDSSCTHISSGGLSHWVQLALNHCKHNQYILIDKGSVRYKVSPNLSDYHNVVCQIKEFAEFFGSWFGN